MRFPRLILTATIALTLAATGCAKDDESTVDPAKPYNDADVIFATDMIQHHAQALQMVDLTLGRDLDPKVAALADEIRMEQTPEIEVMVDLLNKWDRQPVPPTSRDHTNAHSDGEGSDLDTSMPGMMSHEDMEALEAAQDESFESMWVDMMIEHHQGAVEMASTETTDGEDAKAKALAKDIVTSQQAQVKKLQGLTR